MNEQIKIDLKVKEKRGNHYTTIENISNLPVNDCIILLELKYANKKEKPKKKSIIRKAGDLLHELDREAEELFGQ